METPAWAVIVDELRRGGFLCASRLMLAATRAGDSRREVGGPILIELADRPSSTRCDAWHVGIAHCIVVWENGDDALLMQAIDAWRAQPECKECGGQGGDVAQ